MQYPILMSFRSFIYFPSSLLFPFPKSVTVSDVISPYTEETLPYLYMSCFAARGATSRLFRLRTTFSVLPFGLQMINNDVYIIE